MMHSRLRDCPDCKAVFTNRQALYRHRITAHTRRMCLICNFIEGRPNRMRHHIRRLHPKSDVEATGATWAQPWRTSLTIGIEHPEVASLAQPEEARMHDLVESD